MLTNLLLASLPPTLIAIFAYLDYQRRNEYLLYCKANNYDPDNDNIWNLFISQQDNSIPIIIVLLYIAIFFWLFNIPGFIVN